MKNQSERKIKKQATNILEKARRIFGITRDQYAFCQYVHYRCADPRQKVSGWCCDLKEEIGDFVGISRVAVHKMANAMKASGLISISDGGHYKVTETWIDIESDCKQSLHKDGKHDVNFVYTGRKQSLQIEREKRKQSLQTPYSIDNKEFEESDESSCATTTFKIEIFDPSTVEMFDYQLVEENPKKEKSFKGGAAKKSAANTPGIHPENEPHFTYFSNPEKAKAAWLEWIEYKYNQHREKYKAAKSELAKLRQIFKQFNGDSEKFEEAVNYSIGNLYKGIFAPKNETSNGKFQHAHLDKAQQQHARLARFVADIHSGAAFADAGAVDWITGE